jgi:hypothetical protein
MQFLSSLPAVLGLTGFVVYYFLVRNRGGDRITLDIVGKLRQAAPDRLPPRAESFDAATLARLIDGDNTLRSKVSDQDFQLLKVALRQQFIVSIVVYVLCGLVFLAGVGFYIYMVNRPVPLSISSISAESTDPAAQGMAVDLDNLQVRWSSAGEPADIAVSLEALDDHRQTAPKTVRSTESQVVFAPEDYRPLLSHRAPGAANRLRVDIQTPKSLFVSSEFSL